MQKRGVSEWEVSVRVRNWVDFLMQEICTGFWYQILDRVSPLFVRN